jgi:signal peptidase I
MFMRYLFYKVPVLVCLLIALSAVTTARTFPLEKISRGNQEFSGTVSYDVEKAYAGNHNLEVFVSLSTKGLKNLELIKFDPPDQTKIRLTEISKVASFDSATGLQTTVYKYLADIPEGTEPRIYLTTLSLGYPGDKNTNRTVWLYVGVRNKGKLNVIADSINTTEFYTGTTNTYHLELENNFPDFPVNVRSVTIKSDPLDLVESATTPIENTSIDALQRGAIDLKVKTAPLSFSNLLSGFGDSPRLVLNVTYDDSYGRVVTDLSYPVKVKIRPRDRILVIAMLVGVVIGAILRLYLQRLQRRGVITRREKLAAIGITSLIGLVVSFVALVGRIKIVAFDQMGSYDNPGVIFIISLAGAVGGAQLLSTLLKPASGSTDPGPAADPKLVS